MSVERKTLYSLRPTGAASLAVSRVPRAMGNRLAVQGLDQVGDVRMAAQRAHGASDLKPVSICRG